MESDRRKTWALTVGIAVSGVAAETIRYSTGIPGQALGYKTGHYKLLELRERMREARGPGFDIREFHEKVLGNGATPLSALEAHFRRLEGGP